jgi:hypothetical protein
MTRSVRLRMPSAAAALMPLLLMGASGNTTAPEPCPGRARNTLIFYDQSASSAANPGTVQMFRDTITSVSSTRLACYGDAVHAFQLHGGTRAKVNRQDAIDAIAPAVVTGVPKIAAAIATSQRNRRVATLQREAIPRLLRIVSDPIAPEDRRQTDILGSLEVISDEVGRAPGARTLVYFMSDMRESMRGTGRRDFDAQPPSSPAQAQAWADQDVAVLHQMHVDTARLRNVEVRVLLGNLALKPHSSEIRFYWERIFRNAGINPENVRFG